jgi:hypothetical protein
LKIIYDILELIRRFIGDITFAIGKLLDSFINPLENLVLTVTEEERMLGLAPIERPATELFLEFTEQDKIMREIVKELEETFIESLPSIPALIYISTTSLILEFFASMESAILEFFEEPVRASNTLVRGIFSVFTSLIGIVISIIPSPHEKYVPWSLLPPIRLLTMRVELYAESIAESIIAPFSPFIVRFFQISFVKSITGIAKKIITKILKIIRTVTIWINGIFIEGVKIITPLVGGAADVFYSIALVIMRGILLVIYETHISVYYIFRTFAPARELLSLVDKTMQTVSIILPERIGMWFYRTMLSLAREIVPI